MDEDQESLDHKQHTDRLTNFMFGTNYPSNRRKEADQEEITTNRNRGDAWILGSNRESKEGDQEQEGKFDAITNFLDQIDINLLMKNVDSFMTSANELKPLIKKMSPLIKKWLK
ncbi:hypothetical protein [Niallia sp. 03190]|uniref:hypothetical protein n=1 Tax=Niallia sp. 03190 TaxID=3458061 RepID=UPI004043C657